MKVAAQDFRNAFNGARVEGGFNLIFIGMSNSGKTFHSNNIAADGDMRRVEFDEIIGNSPAMAALVADYPGKDMAEKMGNYFGMPWSDSFQEREDRFLVIEREFMAQEWPRGSILDLTGSSIYHPEQMAAIAKTGLVIYLETSAEKRAELLENALKGFKESPKPVCWNGVFNIKEGETGDEALRRCYPQLQAYRAGEYAKYADIVIPHEVHKAIANGRDFIEAAAQALETGALRKPDQRFVRV